jgi:hypothetical protein
VKWATRPNCHVDRTACAWLIGRFIDREATFVFFEDADDVPDDATPFDMLGVVLSHHAGSCSFETFLDHYGLDDGSLRAIAQIVHEADLGDDRFLAPEAAGLDVVIRGLSLTHDDSSLLELTSTIFDGLYEYCRVTSRSRSA